MMMNYEHHGFFNDEPDLFQNRVDYGKLMHSVFQKIITLDDLHTALKGLYNEGKINMKESENLEEDIRQKLLDDRVKNFFTGEWTVLTERDILLPSGRIYRPDRIMMKKDRTVVIDYKFGEKKSKKHKDKMTTYLNQISRMGYSNPAGLIWYVTQNEFVNVSI
jgi:CRISPR/Cas system-associated exonuclease Cas4 (RecB family)